MNVRELKSVLQAVSEEAQVFVMVNGQPLPLRYVSNVCKSYMTPVTGMSGYASPALPLPVVTVHLEV